MNPSLYDVLGVSPDASRDEIKAAWRDASDRFEPGSGASPSQFRMFNEAAEVLLEPERRRAYDEQLAEQPAAEEPAPEPEEAEGGTAWFVDVPSAGEASEPKEAPGARRRVPTPVLAALAVVTVVAMAVAIVLGTQFQRASAYQDSLDQAPSAAERAAAAVLSYSYRSLDADRASAGKFLTSAYRDDYFKTFDSLVKDNATKTKAKVQAKVLASSAMPQSGERDPERVPVLLFVNQKTVSTARNGEPSLALNRVRFDMVEVDGTWLVDGITSY